MSFLDILIPSQDKIIHDHIYAMLHSAQDQQCSDQHDDRSPVEQDESEEICMPNGDSQEFTYEMLGIEVTAKERLDIERETRSQGYNEKWHSVRYKRITGSICGRILCQKKKTVSSLCIASILNLLNHSHHQLFGDVNMNPLL